MENDSSILYDRQDYAIILGLRMENNERDLITDIAKQAGIRNIYQNFINDDGELDAYLLK